MEQRASASLVPRKIEAPIILSMLIQKFKFEFVDTKALEPKPAGTLQLRWPLNLKLTSR